MGISLVFLVYNGSFLFDQTVVQKVVWLTKDDKGTMLKTRQLHESSGERKGTTLVERAVKAALEP